METERKELDQKQSKNIEWLRTLHPFGIYYHISGKLLFLLGLEEPNSMPVMTSVRETNETKSGFWINNAVGSLTPEQLGEHIITLTDEEALASISKVRTENPDDPFEDYMLRCKETFINVTTQSEDNAEI